MNLRIGYLWLRACAAAAVLITAAAANAGAADAAGITYSVSRGGSDQIACSANAAAAPFATIQRALSCAGDGDIISLASSGSKPYPGIGTVSANVTIKAASGATARTITIDAGHGPLNVTPGANATLTGVTLNCLTSCNGSPTVTNQGTLLLSADTVTGNISIPSAAILNTTPDNSDTSAALTIQNSTIANNDSKLGGAIQTNTGTGATGASTLNITNSTLANNVSLLQGGAIAALALTPGSNTTITNTTITANTAQSGGGLYASSPTTLTNTIIAANKIHAGTATDCQSGSLGTPITDGPGGHNLIGNATGCGNITPGTNADQTGTSASPLDPRVGALAYNGGTTETEPPLAGSPVIAAGSAATCLQQPVFNIDQRTQTRNAPGRDVCDIGADDTGGTTPAAAAPAILSSSATATISSPLNMMIRTSRSPVPALTESGALPSGVSFTDLANGMALLSGTPAPGSAGMYPLTITAVNGNGSPAIRTFVLMVEPFAVSGVTPATIAAGASGVAVTVMGTGFQTGATLTASNPGVSISSVVIKGPHSITARVSVTPGAQAGPSDLTVTEPGTTATCTGCLTVAAAA